MSNVTHKLSHNSSIAISLVGLAIQEASVLKFPQGTSGNLCGAEEGTAYQK